METTAATENTQVQDQHKSDVESDSGQDSTLPPLPSRVVEAEDQSTVKVKEEGQEGSLDDPSNHKQVGNVPPKPRRGGSRPRHSQAKRRYRNRNRNLLKSISRRNRVSAALVQVQDKGRGTKEGEEKARHVNEA